MIADPVPGPAARDAVRRELERSEYHRDDPGVLQRVLDWLGRRVASFGDGGLGTSALVVLVVLIVVVAVALAVRAGRPTRRDRSGSRSTADPLTPVGSRDHRRIALGLERDGRTDEALREWLRAAVATIEERGVLAPRPGRTGTATAREAAPALPAAADDLTAAMAAFEQVWFGGQAATSDDIALAHRAADAVASARIGTDAGRAAELRW